MGVYIRGWMSRERTKESHDLYVVLCRMLLGKLPKRVNASQTHRKHIASEHLSALLITLV